VPGGFEVWLDVLEEAVYDPDSVVAANAINAAIELAIARAPAQYQWEYKRFRIPGGPDIYD
jgi:KDO2-lipid IV(A) lauroyltransferase